MWIDSQVLPADQQEVIVCMKKPHHGKTVLACRYTANPLVLPFVTAPAGFCWGGGIILQDEVLCWQPVPDDPRLSEK